jgi:hypothetical protein
MFEVQLGAAVLLQFRTSRGKIVRVLADAGVKASGYSINHVHNKLRNTFAAFGDEDPRLDLIIGTHYDADHLDGLVPIIEDPDIKIAEVWLPPVANDAVNHAFDEPVDDEQLLAHQFYRDKDRVVLRHYLQAKQRICELLRTPRGDEKKIYGRSDFNEPITRDDSLERSRKIFSEYRTQAIEELELNEDTSHADDNRFEPASPQELLRDVEWWRDYGWSRLDYSSIDRNDDSTVGEMLDSVSANSPAGHNCARIRKSAAEDAINAISLAKVVEALRNRKPAVSIACQMIHNGQPKRFAWRSRSERFEAGRKLRAEGPGIVLLGPSTGLVEKHRNRLPIGAYASIARYLTIEIKNITPSNQLSYIALFNADKQNILITGDAGCVDFKPNRTSVYYPELLAAIRPLHVIQVAHHAGNNAHFYRVLCAAGYGDQRNHSFLLVSHAREDQYRPSQEFRMFLEEIRHDDGRVQVLFTSRPLVAKVREFISMIYPAIGNPADVGDVRLAFTGRRWHVGKHAIDLNAT